MVFWTDIYYVFKREFYAVFRDHAVLTFFVALMLMQMQHLSRRTLTR